MRLKEVHFEGFRGISSIKLDRLGRVALIVGKNNSGKTSILEGIHAALDSNPSEVLFKSSRARGELVEERGIADMDGRCLFSGYAFKTGMRALVNVVADSRRVRLTLSLALRSDVERQAAPLPEPYNRPFTLVVHQESTLPDTSRSSSKSFHPATDDGRVAPHVALHPRSESEVAVVNIPAGGLDSNNVGALFDDIVLTPEEPMVVEALQILDERIERIAALRRIPGQDRRGGFVVKFKGSDARVPIGNLGDGTWRMLGLVLSVISARGGVLLVDDIDTGLHYSVMGRMWQLVSSTANRLGVQVVATTHSRDCVESLATIASGVDQGAVSIHRIESGCDRVIAFDEAEIVAAALRGVEVR